MDENDCFHIRNKAKLLRNEIKDELQELEKRFNESDNGNTVRGLTYNLPHAVIKLEDAPSVEEVDESKNNTILEVAE